MIDLERVKITLKQNNKSLTKPRKLILEKLSLNTPLEMRALIKLTSKDIDRASVYRNIELFEELKIVSRIQIGWKYKIEISEKYSPHHHHLICEVCNKIIDTKDLSEIENEINKLALRSSFLAKSHQLEIIGICKDCQKNDPRKIPGSVGSLTLPNT